ncbi:CKLF-like MARVEL transmembrane domain-containing protein 1 [Desmodus rotundus]|uniref:CKLF-like MARVEL transmembrane domain-containing protein 1 n=1 Tax=Desmodus rotundus TaxID=9430 RepID=UPI000D183AA7|nr:CKLF-like MARVEL transmembrane domain-containing protein 1 [Desmodus rotundus]
MGRTRVPSKFRDSCKRFFFSPTGTLKVLRLGLLIGSAACFITAEAHESYIVITVLEACIVLFFILIYMLTLHRLMTYIHWPLLDLINSFITTVFLLIVAVLAMQEKERRHLFYVGGSLCLGAIIVCLIDATVVTKKMRTLMKKALRFGGETSSSPGPAEPVPESREALIPPSSAAPAAAPSRAPSRALSRAPSRAPAAAPSLHSPHH